MGPSERVSRVSQTRNCRLNRKEKLDLDTVRFPCAFLVKRSWKGFSAPPCVSMDPTDTNGHQWSPSSREGSQDPFLLSSWRWKSPWHYREHISTQGGQAALGCPCSYKGWDFCLGYTLRRPMAPGGCSLQWIQGDGSVWAAKIKHGEPTVLSAGRGIDSPRVLERLAGHSCFLMTTGCGSISSPDYFRKRYLAGGPLIAI